MGTTKDTWAASVSFSHNLVKHTYLDLRVVGNRGLAVFARYRHLEDAEAVLGHGCRIAVPVVEVADEVCSHGVRSPLAVYDVAVGLDVEPILLIALQKPLDQQSSGAGGSYSLLRTSRDRLLSRQSS